MDKQLHLDFGHDMSPTNPEDAALANDLDNIYSDLSPFAKDYLDHLAQNAPDLNSQTVRMIFSTLSIALEMPRYSLAQKYTAALSLYTGVNNSMGVLGNAGRTRRLERELKTNMDVLECTAIEYELARIYADNKLTLKDLSEKYPQLRIGETKSFSEVVDAIEQARLALVARVFEHTKDIAMTPSLAGVRDEMLETIIVNETATGTMYEHDFKNRFNYTRNDLMLVSIAILDREALELCESASPAFEEAVLRITEYIGPGAEKMRLLPLAQAEFLVMQAGNVPYAFGMAAAAKQHSGLIILSRGILEGIQRKSLKGELESSLVHELIHAAQPVESLKKNKVSLGILEGVTQALAERLLRVETPGWNISLPSIYGYPKEVAFMEALAAATSENADAQLRFLKEISDTPPSKYIRALRVKFCPQLTDEQFEIVQAHMDETFRAGRVSLQTRGYAPNPQASQYGRERATEMIKLMYELDQGS